MEAVFHRRDVADIERQCAERSATEAATRHVFDIQSHPFQDFEFEVLEEQFKNGEEAWHDCEGAEEFEGFEDEREEGEDSTARSSAASRIETDERIKRVSAAKDAHGIPKKRRLEEKKAPQNTNYPDGALVAKA